MANSKPRTAKTGRKVPNSHELYSKLVACAKCSSQRGRTPCHADLLAMCTLRVLAIGLVACALALPAAAWNVHNFPNPQESPRECGRDVTGWVCSPDNLVPKDTLSVVEGHIRAIYNGETPYSKVTCPETGTAVSAEVLVAVVESVEGSGSAPARAQAFARGLHDRFGVGTCGSGVVFLVSVMDRQVRCQATRPCATTSIGTPAPCHMHSTLD